jgi:hypothetical protein
MRNMAIDGMLCMGGWLCEMEEVGIIFAKYE